MSDGDDTPDPRPLDARPLDRAALDLARQHVIGAGAPAPLDPLARLSRFPVWLDGACRDLQHADASLSKAAEWLLDNAHLIQRAARQIEKDLPAGFYSHLRPLVGGIPRVYAVARELLRFVEFRLAGSTVSRFVSAYQDVAPLDMAELWAMPTMLRLVCLEELAAALERLAPRLASPFRSGPTVLAGRSLEDVECIARATRTLRVLAEISWMRFVRETSVVDAALRADPAGAYARMEAESADLYRKAVEHLARATGRPEIDVARAAVARARDFTDESPRLNHVGYWLVDEGYPAFERSFGGRPDSWQRLRRFARRHARGAYLVSLTVFTLAPLALPAALLQRAGAGPGSWVLGVLGALLPASMLGIGLTQWAVGRLVRPRVLPKIKVDATVGQRCKTAVVVPALLSGAGEVDALLQNLERHYLSNPHAFLQFVLLTDHVDAAAETMPGDGELVGMVIDGIRRLNRRHGQSGQGPFHLLHRRRRYSPGEACWMGWERKRGKLDQFNRFLAGEDINDFTVHEGAAAGLRGDVRYVISLDADTVLPAGAAARLIGILEHPLNRAEVDPETGRVVAGYTIVQPRVEISPANASRTLFARLSAGDTAIDIYSRAVSDTYQDLFGEGVYVGKGIYDLDAFRRTAGSRIPENAILSHDLLEGLLARAALATDVIVYEELPDSYLTYSRRLHRWIRGDWQLLPWLGRRVPAADGSPHRSTFSAIDCWKIVDNLRRSLLAPALLMLLVVGWLVLPGDPLIWTVLAVFAPAAHIILDLGAELIRFGLRPRRGDLLRRAMLDLRESVARWALLVAFLPCETVGNLDAIARTLFRLAVSRRHLLEWTTAAQTEASLGERTSLLVYAREFAAAPLLAVALAGGVMAWHPTALPAALPILLLWFLAPWIAYRVSCPTRRIEAPLDASQRAFLRRLARRTWLFFETFVGPDDHWLPPDNCQGASHVTIAHRTSPTNIGMILLSTLAAWDLGYIGTTVLAYRLRNTIDTMRSMERYRGHLYNWYATTTLEVLQPRYVSTVDSGNLAAALLVLEEACLEAGRASVLRTAPWDGLVDTLAILEDDIRRLASRAASASGSRAEPLLSRVVALGAEARRARDRPARHGDVLARMVGAEIPELDRQLTEWIAKPPASIDLAVLHDLRVWVERLHQQLRELRREREGQLAWLPLLESFAAAAKTAASEIDLAALGEQLSAVLPATLTLDSLEHACGEAHRLLEPLRAELSCDTSSAQNPSPLHAWCDDFARALQRSQSAAGALGQELLDLSQLAAEEALRMDFRGLYDTDKRLFFIGYDHTANRLDSNHYDLLASEARLASFVAIAKGDVPVEHWFALDRSITDIAGAPGLLSWGGTMFEYLMPPLLLGTHDGTLLATSQMAAVEAQRAYASKRRVPWGISESGYAAVNPEGHYRYRAFGVPSLGLKRGLSEDLVVAPYASALALPMNPQAATRNLERLAEMPMMGAYGLYEAADFTPDRVPEGRESVPVLSYMAHHQGMILAALDNALCDGVLVRRFQVDPCVRSAELLLYERVPVDAPIEAPIETQVAPELRPQREVIELPAWQPVPSDHHPEVHGLGNGRMGSFVTAAGAGGLRWRNLALTRWNPDSALEDTGIWIYVLDEESGALWSVGHQPLGRDNKIERVVFEAHKVELTQRRDGIFHRLEIAVAPSDDVEIRSLTLINESERPRRLRVFSYGEVALAAPADDERHPAFSKLFVTSEHIEGVNGLLFERRAREPNEEMPLLLHRLTCHGRAVKPGRFETDRARFLGRGGSIRDPQGIASGLSSTVGATLDPVMVIEARVDLAARASERLAFVTIAAASRASLIEIAERYETLPSLDWVMRDAAVEARHRVRRLGMSPESLSPIQQLLSRLLYPDPALRCPASTIEANDLGQHGLWGLGISGDLPILLLRSGSQRDPKTTYELIQAQSLWRSCGAAVDLVVLWQGGSGYEDEGLRDLHSVVQRMGAQEWLERDGGIHFVREDQIPREQRRLLEATARVILDADAGLARQLAARADTPQRPARIAASRGPQSDLSRSPIERPSGLLFDNGIGGFTADGREYCIYLEPGDTTPAPWCNILANGDFGTMVSESGLGFSWALNSAENRLTPWSNDPVLDPPGESIYLRDEETAVVWTPTPQPAGADSAYRVMHGAGTSEWQHRSHGLEQRLHVFVATGAPVKVVRLRLHNELARPRRITATYCAEWVLGTSRGASGVHVVSEYDAVRGALLAKNAWTEEFAGRVAFLASDRRPHGFTTDRVEFFGRNGDRREPAALRRLGLTNHIATGGDACAALQVHVDLAPDETTELLFVLGQGRDAEDARELLTHWRQASVVDAEREALTEYWDRRLGAIQVRTPEPSMDLLLNRWLLYQTISSRWLARAGFYQPGGAIGFRDQLQDVMALTAVEPDLVRQHILTCAGAQFEEGDVLHWWHPPAARGVRTRCSDDLLWLPFVTAHYVATTGDTAVLDEPVPFLSAPVLEPEEHDRYATFTSGERSASLFEHCSRAIEKGLTSGAHGLPLMGAGDWNDGMSRIGIGGRGESVWLAWFAIAATSGFADLCARSGDSERAEALRRRAEEIAGAVEQFGWDGGWYLRAFDDEGLRWGSAESEECRIDLVSQAWAVLSGVGDPERAGRALAAAESKLVSKTERLILLLWPPFDRTPRDPGYIRAYPPGIRENGGQYSHAATWLAGAFARRGDGDRATRLFGILNPILHARDLAAVQKYAVEPYVMAGDIGSVAPHAGRGGWTWYTGSAAWAWRLGVEEILGIRRADGQIAIDPCIPRDWGRFEAVVRCDEGILEVSVEDPQGVGHGVAELRLDGAVVEVAAVALPLDGATHHLEVRLGSPSVLPKR